MKTVRKSRGKQIIEATKRNAARTIDQAVEKGLEVMNFLVPVRSGNLKSHNQGESDGNGHGRLENDCEYGVPVEFGTFNSAAQPFFRPGVDAARQTIKRGMKVTDR